MNSILNFDELLRHLSERKVVKRLAVVWPEDDATRGAVARALQAGFVTAIMVGARQAVENDPQYAELMDRVTFVDTDDKLDAAQKAVALVREGGADVLMKGFINTDQVLRAVLNKETGILPKGNVLTHIAVAQMPQYHKLLFFTDAAVIPYPTPEQRTEQIKYVTALCRQFGIAEPKIALIHCSEHVDERHFPCTADYLEQKKRAEEGFFGPVRIDGPLDLKTSCSPAALKAKNMESCVEGDADAVIVPDIEAGNVFYKTITLFCGAITAGILQGPTAPVVVPSRGDSPEAKFLSIAMAAMAHQ